MSQWGQQEPEAGRRWARGRLASSSCAHLPQGRHGASSVSQEPQESALLAPALTTPVLPPTCRELRARCPGLIDPSSQQSHSGGFP